MHLCIFEHTFSICCYCSISSWETQEKEFSPGQLSWPLPQCWRLASQGAWYLLCLLSLRQPLRVSSCEVFSTRRLIQGWIKSCLPVLFRTDSFKTEIDNRQFQKSLLVIDSFGPIRCGKHGLKSFGILGFGLHTHLSLLYIESAMRVDNFLQHSLKNIDLCFWKFW